MVRSGWKWLRSWEARKDTVDVRGVSANERRGSVVAKADMQDYLYEADEGELQLQDERLYFKRMRGTCIEALITQRPYVGDPLILQPGSCMTVVWFRKFKNNTESCFLMPSLRRIHRAEIP